MLLHGLFFSFGDQGHLSSWASHCGGFSCCRWAYVAVVCGLSSCTPWALEHWRNRWGTHGFFTTEGSPVFCFTDVSGLLAEILIFSSCISAIILISLPGHHREQVTSSWKRINNLFLFNPFWILVLFCAMIMWFLSLFFIQLIDVVIPSSTHVWLFATSWTAAPQASLSLTISWSLSKFMSIASVMPSALSSSDALFFCPQSFPVSGSLPMSWLFTSSDHNVGASASASVYPMSIQGWFSLRLTVWSPFCPRDSQESSPEPQFERHQFFSTLPSLWSISHNCTWPLERPYPWLFGPLLALSLIMCVPCSVGKSWLTCCNPMICIPPGSSVYRIFQARILEWVAIFFPMGTFQSRDQTYISCTARWIL